MSRYWIHAVFCLVLLAGCKKKNTNLRLVGTCPGSKCAPWVEPVVTPCENLLLNGSFEQTTGDCPFTYSQTDKCLGLTLSTDATADYFRCCGKGAVQIPDNHFGIQNPYDGQAYAGGGIVGNAGDYMEYIQMELRQPLVVGQSYRITLQVSLSDNSRNAYGPIGVAAVPDQLSVNGANLTGIVTPNIEFGKVVTDKNCWEELSGTFVADNASRFIIIGIFRKIKDMDRVGTGGSLKNILFKSYIYYDAVRLECM